MTETAATISFEDTPDPDQQPEDTQQDTDLDSICHEWAAWCRSRRFYAAPPIGGHILGKLSSKTSPSRRIDAPGPACRMDLSALHLAIAAQPWALDRKVFWLYYVHRAGSIKQAAHMLDISRQHWYRLLRDFRRRVWVAAKEIQGAEERARDALPHYEATV